MKTLEETLKNLENVSLMDARGNIIKPFNQNETFDIKTVALALSRTMRFFGQTKLSVAQHCVNMARYFIAKDEHTLALQALLHEISEAFLGDLVSPLKKEIPLFKELENAIIEKAFKIENIAPYNPEVKKLDTRIVINEALELMPKRKHWLNMAKKNNIKKLSKKEIKKAKIEIKPWGQKKAYKEFIKLAKLLNSNLIK